MGVRTQRPVQAVQAARPVWSGEQSERFIVAMKRLTPVERKGRTWST